MSLFSLPSQDFEAHIRGQNASGVSVASFQSASRLKNGAPNYQKPPPQATSTTVHRRHDTLSTCRKLTPDTKHFDLFIFSSAGFQSVWIFWAHYKINHSFVRCCCCLLKRKTEDGLMYVPGTVPTPLSLTPSLSLTTDYIMNVYTPKHLGPWRIPA